MAVAYSSFGIFTHIMFCVISGELMRPIAFKRSIVA